MIILIFIYIVFQISMKNKDDSDHITYILPKLLNKKEDFLPFNMERDHIGRIISVLIKN